MLTEPDHSSPPSPLPEMLLTPQSEGPVRRFFRDVDSAGNLEDGMEFHAAGIVIDKVSQNEGNNAEITVLYLNPFTSKAERRSRALDSVLLYEFPPHDGVYWHLWEQTRAKLERLLAEQTQPAGPERDL